MTAKEKNMLVNSFHSELTGDTKVHAYFIEMISQSKKKKSFDSNFIIFVHAKNPGPVPWT